jgi:chromosome partitioning protein
MKTLTILSRKGGSGKTTVAISLALAARQAGLKVMLADIDPLQSATEMVRVRSEAPSFLVESSASKLFILQEACRQDRCDLLIVDTPTGPEAEIIRAITLSDFCLAVARPTALDVSAARLSIGLIHRAGCPGLLVLNQCPPLRDGEEPMLVRQAIEKLHFCKFPIAASKLRSRAAYQHAFTYSRGVTEWNPRSDAAADVLKLLDEINARLMLRKDASLAPKQDAAPASPVHDLLDRISASA